MTRLLAVCLGGALGSGLRYLVTMAFAACRWGARMPFATWSVNVLGSFFFAWIMGKSAAGHGPDATMKLFLTTGLMGGFTTYSTFNADTLNLLMQGQTAKALANMAVTLAVSLGAGALGFWLGSR